MNLKLVHKKAFKMTFKSLILILLVPFVMCQAGERCRQSNNPRDPNLISHPTNCSKFFACGNGEWSEMECPARLHFNQEKKICDWPSIAQCKVPYTNAHQVPAIVEETLNIFPGQRCVPSTHKNKPRIAPNPVDCTTFLLCIGYWTSMECPRGLIFSTETLHCEHPESAKCNGKPYAKCQHEGEVYGNSLDCRSYFKCSNGIKINVQCANGTMFNATKGKCIEGTCESMMYQLIDKQDPNLPHCPVDDILYPNYRDCGRFFICNGGTIVDQSCPPNTFFSIKHKSCKPPAVAICAGANGKVD